MDEFDLGKGFDHLRVAVGFLDAQGRDVASLQDRLETLERQWENLIAEIAQLQLDIFVSLEQADRKGDDEQADQHP